MLIRWICEKCNKKWIYPITRCVYCKGEIKKIVSKKFKVIGITKVNIPNPYHPIVPYYVLLLEDEYGNRMPKKTMKEFRIGDIYEWKPAKTEHAVAIVKVKYDVGEAVKRAIELIGDVEVNKDTKILIKPSVIEAAYPYRGITTNPKVIGGVIDYLIEKGAKKYNITIAEKIDNEKGLYKSGLTKFSEYNLVNIRDTDFIEKYYQGVSFEITRLVYENDLIINVPVLKTHLFLGIAGALENMTRIVSDKTYKELQKVAIKAIAYLHKVIPNYVTIGDATIGLQGNGPADYGEPAFLNMVLASKDPVAHDKVFQEIGLLPQAKCVEYAGKLGVGKSELDEIEIVGEELKACQRELKPPIGSRLIKHG